MDITDLMTGKSTGTGENKSYNETMSITGMSGVSCLLDSGTMGNLGESKTTKSGGNKSLLSGGLTSGMTGLSEMDLSGMMSEMSLGNMNFDEVSPQN